MAPVQAACQGMAYLPGFGLPLLCTHPSDGPAVFPTLLMCRIAVDFVARQDNLSKDLDAVLRQLNARRDNGGWGSHNTWQLAGTRRGVCDVLPLALHCLPHLRTMLRLLHHPHLFCTFRRATARPGTAAGHRKDARKVRERRQRAGSTARRGTHGGWHRHLAGLGGQGAVLLDARVLQRAACALPGQHRGLLLGRSAAALWRHGRWQRVARGVRRSYDLIFFMRTRLDSSNIQCAPLMQEFKVV